MKKIYDPLHGYITLDAEELAVVDSLPFQRLHRIHQNGPAYLVYPTAQHTRFSHSLGVYQVMVTFANKLAERGAINGDEQRVLKLAALLHDIGHFPFSHMIRKWESKKGRFLSHEEMAERIIEQPDLRSVIKKPEDREEIAQTIAGEIDNPIFAYLMSSDIDVDRIDYLLRDAYHTGVTYGGIDLNRIAEIMDYDDEGLCFQEKGITAVENFLLARYHMYEAIYNHKTVVAFRLLLERIHQMLVEKGNVYDGDAVQSLNPNEWNSYTDGYLLHQMKDACTGATILSEMIEDFFHRRPLKPAGSAIVYDREEPDDRYTDLQDLSAPQERQDFSSSIGVDPRWVFYEELSNEFVKFQEQTNPVRIKTDSKDIVNLVEFRPHFSRIAKKEIRVYTRSNHRKIVREELEKLYGI